MRQKISDRNVLPSLSLEHEYEKLHRLFYDASAFGKTIAITQKARPSMSYGYCLSMMFLDWELRGSFTSVEEMEFKLGISEDDFASSVTEERLLDYIQFLANAIIFVDKQVREHRYNIYANGDTIYNAIVDNSHLVLEKLGAEMVDAGTEIAVVYKNDVASFVSLQDEELEASLVEYLKVDNKGNLKRKGEILCTMAKRLEENKTKLYTSEFKLLFSDTTMLLNKIGARHSLKQSDGIEARFLAMKSDELESWYDRTFQMSLTCIAALPYLEFKPDIQKIKSTTA